MQTSPDVSHVIGNFREAHENYQFAIPGNYRSAVSLLMETTDLQFP